MKLFRFPPLLLAAALCAAPLVRGRPLVLSLGDGLTFVRVHRLPGDLPHGSALQGHPLVLDLRYVKGGAVEAADLKSWLQAHAAVKRPVIMLVNTDTSAALLDPLSSADAVPGVVIIGPDTAGFSVDIVVTVPPADERKAYDALDRGANPLSLVNDNPPKARDDEARLEREHISDEDDDAPEDDSADHWRPPLVDRELQRAVQLDRALIALKRV